MVGACCWVIDCGWEAECGRSDVSVVVAGIVGG